MSADFVIKLSKLLASCGVPPVTPYYNKYISLLNNIHENGTKEKYTKMYKMDWAKNITDKVKSAKCFHKMLILLGNIHIKKKR